MVFRAEVVVTDRPAAWGDASLGLFLTLEEGADSAVVNLLCSKGAFPDPWDFSCRGAVQRGERFGKRDLISARNVAATVPSNGKLRLTLEFSACSPIRRSAEELIPVVSRLPASTFGQSLWKSKNFADVRFIVRRHGNREKTFQVHSFVLNARSEVFSAMFLNPDTQESKSMTVVIKDMGFRAAEDFLQFMYTDKCGALEESCKNLTRLRQLLRAVDKYQVLPLKDRLADKLFSILTPDNAGRIALMAETYNVSRLTDALVAELAMPGNYLGRKWMERASVDFKQKVLRAIGEAEEAEEVDVSEEEEEDEEDDDSLSQEMEEEEEG